MGPSQGPEHLWDPKLELKLGPELELWPLLWLESWALVGSTCDPWPCSLESTSRAGGEPPKQDGSVCGWEPLASWA